MDLDVLAADLSERYGEEVARAGHPLFLSIPTDSAGELLVDEPIPVPDPSGFMAPPWIGALAAVGTGRLRVLEPGVECPGQFAPGLAGGVKLSYVVDRSGRTGWQMILPGGGRSNLCPQVGRMPDTLKRCLMLPTPPPEEPVSVVLAVSWLSTVAVVGDGRRLTWSEVLALQPSEATIGSWEDLRRAVAGGPDGMWVIPAQEAAWMDEGMFSRETLAFLPDIGELLDDVRRSLEPAAARRLAHVVRRCR